MRLFLFIILAAAVLGMFAAAGGIIIGKVGRWLRHVLLAGLTAIALGVVAGLAFSAAGAAEPELIGLVVGLLAASLIMVRVSGGRLPAPRELGIDSPASRSGKPSNSSTRPSRFSRFTARGRRADQLEEAWSKLDHVWPGSSRLVLVRSNCDRLLELADAECLDSSVLEWAIFIRKRIPQLTAAFERQYARAPALERAKLRDELLDSLERVAAEAERRAYRSHSSNSEFDLHRQHIARRTAQHPFEP